MRTPQSTIYIPSSAYLFEQNRELLHTTSIIKYPVFVKGKNYTGHQPPIERSPMLHRYAYEHFPKELSHITTPALVIPLGKTVNRVIHTLNQQDLLPRHHYISDFPHPSGANGHRSTQLAQQKENIRAQVSQWVNQHT